MDRHARQIGLDGEIVADSAAAQNSYGVLADPSIPKSIGVGRGPKNVLEGAHRRANALFDPVTIAEITEPRLPRNVPAPCVNVYAAIVVVRLDVPNDLGTCFGNPVGAAPCAGDLRVCAKKPVERHRGAGSVFKLASQSFEMQQCVSRSLPAILTVQHAAAVRLDVHDEDDWSPGGQGFMIGAGLVQQFFRSSRNST